jgi:glycosyltransferase involved in cell wall biosynthesis
VIYLCIPAHNEAPTIGILLWKIRKVMAEFGRDYEILVLDDGSTDDTREVLDRYRRSLPLRILTSGAAPTGYAAAAERLLREASRLARYPKRDVVILLQGDFTEDPEAIVAMVKAVEGGADVVASHASSPASPRLPLALRLSAWVGRWLLGKPDASVPSEADPLSSLRGYRVMVLRRLFEAKAPILGGGAGAGGDHRWSVSAQLLALSLPHARRVESVPCRMEAAPRARPSRLQLVPALKSLLPLRGLLRGTSVRPPHSPMREAA